jgi:hypothetical protein
MATSFSGGRSPERTTDHGQATGKMYHLQLCNRKNPKGLVKILPIACSLADHEFI